jgi:flagellar assembly protein FliH
VDPIIRSVTLAAAPRRLERRTGAAHAAVAPTAAVPATAPPAAVDTPPPLPPAPPPALDAQERAALRAEMERELASEREALRRHADAQLAEASAEAERRAYVIGEEKGIAEGKATLSAQARRLAAVAEQLGKARHALLAAAEDDAVDIVFAAICQMVGASVADRAQVKATVSHWLAQARAGQTATVRLHPDDHALLTGPDDVADAGSGIVLLADAEVKLGGCVVETGQGTLDGRFENHLQQLGSALAATRAARRREASS